MIVRIIDIENFKKDVINLGYNITDCFGNYAEFIIKAGKPYKFLGLFELVPWIGQVLYDKKDKGYVFMFGEDGSIDGAEFNTFTEFLAFIKLLEKWRR